MEETLWFEEEGSLQWEGEDVLHWSVKLPQFSENKKGEKRLQRYYTRVWHHWNSHWNNHLFPLVCADLQEKREKSQVFYPWSVSLISTQHILEKPLISVGISAKEKRGRAISKVAFFGDLWNIREGVPLNPRKYPPLSLITKKELLTIISNLAQAQKDIKLNPSYSSDLENYFMEKNILLKENEIEIYFPQDTIAPPEEGTPKFTISSDFF